MRPERTGVFGGSDNGRSRYTGHRSGPGGLNCGMEGTSTEENLLMREIEDHPVVSSLCFIRAIGRDRAGYRANLRCGCKQVGPVRMWSKRRTLQD